VQLACQPVNDQRLRISVRDTGPGIAPLDLQMPDMPGTEVLRRLRADPATAEIPVVILTADARPGLHTRLLDQGVRAMLTKPLDVKEFLGLLDAIANEYEQAAPSTRAIR
jgi:CheY-like chemotaxis protein